MSKIHLGKNIVARALADQSVRPFTEAGLTATWLGTEASAAIFEGQTARAYAFLLRHAGKHGRVPTLARFREDFPEASYRLPAEPELPSELIELVRTETDRTIIQLAQMRIQDILTAPGAVQGDDQSVFLAASVIQQAADQLGTGIRQRSQVLNLTEAIDREKYFAEKLTRGAPFGVAAVDDDFYGIQPGQLVTLIGSPKSSKTFLALNSAVQAWLEGWNVLFYTFEMGPTEIRDRAYALGGHVNPENIRRRELPLPHRRQIEDFMDMLEGDSGAGEDFRIIEGGRYAGYDEIRADVIKYDPHMVYIDGAYFLFDATTRKKAGSDWQANENVSGDLNDLARQLNIGLFVTTQAQVKQMARAGGGGVQGHEIMGGTGLLRTSHLVMGVHMDLVKRVLSLNSIYCRNGHVNSGKYQWDWDTMILNGALDTDLEDDIREMGI